MGLAVALEINLKTLSAEKESLGIQLDQFADCPLSSFEALILRIAFFLSFSGKNGGFLKKSTCGGGGDGKETKRKVAWWLQFMGVKSVVLFETQQRGKD
ncbi:hypothetical protein TSUD_381870 [Trifolium subterraneum]|uniref:Uncharacterized protein n=1 Tax=Trifolium subterraneum TaxID=3900 RepID=A0A2Z6MV80_TRISU|nr:hypothetical protein TSUD_381870 [Trifolium subterraneum]